MQTMPHDIIELERYILEHIPLARAMQLRVADWDGHRLQLAAPLTPNINDKDCAFGGSLSSLMTLAGWGATVLLLAARGVSADVFVARSEIRYLAPLFGDLRARAEAAPETKFDAL
ncbi:MAG TPA: YiiD C-terminal domain-containing protein, partial [Rhodanobacteraceae bacterium]|nr:YiiD C-terminal domain-containing protein [Rhodanobacteraceae bacterium]